MQRPSFRYFFSQLEAHFQGDRKNMYDNETSEQQLNIDYQLFMTIAGSSIPRSDWQIRSCDVIFLWTQKIFAMTAVTSWSEKKNKQWTSILWTKIEQTWPPRNRETRALLLWIPRSNCRKQICCLAISQNGRVVSLFIASALLFHVPMITFHFQSSKNHFQNISAKSFDYLLRSKIVYLINLNSQFSRTVKKNKLWRFLIQ